MDNYILKEVMETGTVLSRLAKKYNVDIYELGYIPYYEQRFDSIRGEVKKVLEIGVETGCSHRMWLEYFPNATIYGFDIFNEEDRSGYVQAFKKLMKGNPYLDRSVCFKGNQQEVKDMNRFLIMYGNDFDLIIDDGGHTMRQQQITLKVLFDAVKSGGQYVIEDLHTCSGQWKSLYGFDVIEDGDTLTTDLVKSLESRDNSITQTNYINEIEMKSIRENIISCKLEIGNENYSNYIWPTMLSFIEKK